MKKWKIGSSMIAATLFAATAAQAQNVIFSDDFEDTTLDAYNLNIGGSDAQNIDESGNRVAELAHVNGIRTGLGNNVLAGFNLARFDFGFKVKVLSSPAPDDATVELARDHYGSGLERIFQLNLDDNVSAQDAWDTFPCCPEFFHCHLLASADSILIQIPGVSMVQNFSVILQAIWASFS